MKTRFLIPVLAILLAHTVSAQSLLLGRNIFPEGTFDVFGESKLYPSGWTFPDPNDKPWHGGYRAEVIKGEAGTKELRIIRPEPTGATMVGAKFPLPAKIERLRVSFRILAKAISVGEPDSAGNGAGIYARFYDASSQAIPGAAGWVGGLAKSADAEWQDKEMIFPVPATATTLELHIIFRSATGEVRFDDVEIVPVAMSE